MKKTLLFILLFFPFFALGQAINAAFEKGVWGSDVISTEICPQNNSPQGDNLMPQASTFLLRNDTVTIIIINDFQNIKKNFSVREIIDNSLSGVLDMIITTEDYYNFLITGYTDSQGKQNILSIKIYQQLLIGLLEKPILN